MSFGPNKQHLATPQPHTARAANRAAWTYSHRAVAPWRVACSFNTAPVTNVLFRACVSGGLNPGCKVQPHFLVSPMVFAMQSWKPVGLVTVKCGLCSSLFQGCVFYLFVYALSTENRRLTDVDSLCKIVGKRARPDCKIFFLFPWLQTCEHVRLVSKSNTRLWMYRLQAQPVFFYCFPRFEVVYSTTRVCCVIQRNRVLSEQGGSCQCSAFFHGIARGACRV
jgi:hypothetical protein